MYVLAQTRISKFLEKCSRYHVNNSRREPLDTLPNLADFVPTSSQRLVTNQTLLTTTKDLLYAGLESKEKFGSPISPLSTYRTGNAALGTATDIPVKTADKSVEATAARKLHLNKLLNDSDRKEIVVSLGLPLSNDGSFGCAIHEFPYALYKGRNFGRMYRLTPNLKGPELAFYYMCRTALKCPPPLMQDLIHAAIGRRPLP